MSQLCPADILSQHLNAANIADTQGIPFKFGDYIGAVPGASFAQIQQQIDNFASQFAPNAQSIPYDFNFAVGGNYALNWLSNTITSMNALNVVRDFQDKFLPQYQQQMESLLERIIQLKQRSDAIGDIKHIFVTGVPDLGKSDQLFFLTDTGSSATKVNMNIPGLRGIATAICTRMDDAMLKAIEADEF